MRDWSARDFIFKAGTRIVLAIKDIRCLSLEVPTKDTLCSELTNNDSGRSELPG